jgi:hypothetical protein
MPSDAPSPTPARRGRKPKPRLLELRITLADIEPPIWRRVRVPDAYTLHQLPAPRPKRLNRGKRLNVAKEWVATCSGSSLIRGRSEVPLPGSRTRTPARRGTGPDR